MGLYLIVSTISQITISSICVCLYSQQIIVESSSLGIRHFALGIVLEHIGNTSSLEHA